MAAPVASTRVTPTGKQLGNGWQTSITFALNTAVKLWEQEVTPMGMDGGDAIDMTTQLNTRVMTKHPASLYDTTDGQASCSYDPAVLNDIKSLINKNTTITYRFPDGSTWAVYGYLRSFKPQRLANKQRPMADVVVVHTNLDPVNCVEAEPVYAAGTGTGCY